ncbi:MAG: hypothetical protein ACI4NE_07815 [Succinivibrio sp.]
MNLDLFLNKNADALVQKGTRLIALLPIINILCFFIFVPMGNDDVVYFKEQSLSYNWLIDDRYMTWSSRILLESVLPFLCNHDFVFRVVSVLFVFVNIYSLKKIFNGLSNPLLLLFLSLIPFYNFTSAGLVATTVNYYYPAVLGIFIVSVLSQDRKQSADRYSILLFLTVCFSSIVAVNHEQVSLILLVLSAYYLYKNKYKSIPLLVLVISVAGLINCAICPGNHLRVIAETAKWMPEFSEYGFFNKVYLGIVSSLYFLNFSEPFFLVLITAVLTYLLRRKLWIVLITLVIIYLILRLPVRMNLKTAGVMLDGSFIYNFPLPSLVVLLLFDLMILFLIIKNSFDQNTKIILISLFVFANMLRASVGFSPTVFASLSRPSIFSEIIIVLECMLIFENIRSRFNHISMNKLISLLCCFALYSNVRTLITIVD